MWPNSAVVRKPMYRFVLQTWPTLWRVQQKNKPGCNATVRKLVICDFKIDQWNVTLVFMLISVVLQTIKWRWNRFGWQVLFCRVAFPAFSLTHTRQYNLSGQHLSRCKLTVGHVTRPVPFTCHFRKRSPLRFVRLHLPTPKLTVLQEVFRHNSVCFLYYAR